MQVDQGMLAAAIARAVAAEVERGRRRVGTVEAFTATRVSVRMPGGTLSSLAYLSSYTPAVGHVVNIDCSAPDSWLVLGRSAT